MTKQEQIEDRHEIASIINGCLRDGYCNASQLARRITQAGYGNVSQAIKEFAEKLKEKLQSFIYDNEDYDGKLDSGILCVDLIGVIGMNGEIISLGLIDRLLKEYEK